tara:strand:- start:120 stop:722 length:603 start_codon:yes stop_codon:yes gene_type:complete
MINISKEQIKKAFVSDVNNIGEYVYNNQDWYQQDSQRIRYILATLELSPGDSYADKKQLELGQEDNRFYGCIEFGDNGSYTIKDEALLSELIVMTDAQLEAYVNDNEYDWIGDDYDHANEYLFGIMNHWQDKIEFDTEDYDNCDQMTVTTRSREWNVDPETGYKSENKFEVAYQILMDYYNELPEDTRAEVDKRLEAVEC